MTVDTTRICLPGDILKLGEETSNIPGDKKNALKLGPGLIHEADIGTVVTRAGLLQTVENGRRLWIDKNMNRYVPSVGESVVGVIIARHAEGFRVDIGGAHPAALDAMAFEGASKRNKPNLKVGGIVYARVSLAHRDMDPEIECVNPTTHKSDGFGELKNGFMINCSLGLARLLLTNQHPLLKVIGARHPFEVAIGTNGRIWVETSEIENTILIIRALEWADDADPEQRGLLTEKDVRSWMDENVMS